MKTKLSINKVNTIYCIFGTVMVFMSSVIAQPLEEHGTSLADNGNLEVKLSPKIKVMSEMNSGRRFSFASISSYLKNAISIENPKLKGLEIKSRSDLKKTINPLLDLNLDQNSRVVVGFSSGQNSWAMLHDEILVSGLLQDDHINYMLVKPEHSYYHPETKEYLGTLLIAVANATIIDRNDLSTLKIDATSEPVVKGMLALPSRSLELYDEIKYLPNPKKIRSYILSFMQNNLLNNYVNSIVVLGVGAREGVKVGNTFKILYKKIDINNPYLKGTTYSYHSNQYKGEILVYQVFNKLSLGIVITATPEIAVLDAIISTHNA